jgi:hypothetical protein
MKHKGASWLRRKVLWRFDHRCPLCGTPMERWDMWDGRWHLSTFRRYVRSYLCPNGTCRYETIFDDCWVGCDKGEAR